MSRSKPPNSAVPGHPEPPLAEPRGDDLGLVVEERHARRPIARGRVLQVDGDRVALDGVDVDAVAEPGGDRARAHARADHHAVVARAPDLDAPVERAQPLDLAAHLEGHAPPLQPPRDARREAVDVARGVAGRPEPAHGPGGEPRLEPHDVPGLELVAHEPRLGVEPRHLPGVREVGLGLVEVQDPGLGAVVVHPSAGRHLLEDGPRRQRQPHRLDRVGAVAADVAHELGHPRDLVPARHGVDEQRRVVPQHPFEALQDRGPGRPDLGVRGRELAAVGVARLHRRIAVAVDDGDVEPRLVEVIGGRHAGDPGAENGDARHGGTPRALRPVMPPPSKT